MLPGNPRKIYFKHVYGSDVNEWGCVAFPTYQNASDAAGLVKEGDVVLLAITKAPKTVSKLKPKLKGCIYAVCKLQPLHISTKEIANPELLKQYPEIAQNWRVALPVTRVWEIDEPKNYDEFCMGEITQRVSAQRGHLIDFDDLPNVRNDIREWYNSATGREQECFQSKRTSRVS